MPYDYAVDMWSVGATLYELYIGKILFTGDSNNQMLKTIMEVRGRLTPKLYKRGQLSSVHFDEQGHFLSVERDKVLNKVRTHIFPLHSPGTPQFYGGPKNGILETWGILFWWLDSG